MLPHPRLLLITLVLGAAVAPGQRPWRVLMEGSRFSTPCYRQHSDKPGPKILILAGVHGNEPAGARAAAQITHWRPQRGTLLVIPRVNQPALAAEQRRIPGVPRAQGDLNRHFPRTAQDHQRSKLAAALWRLVRAEKPDWVLDLHEGFDFGRINKKSVGSSIIAARQPPLEARVARMLAAVDATIARAEHKFMRRGPPVLGSLARAAHDHLGIPAMILETTSKDQPLSRRARQHRLMVHRLLVDLEVLAADADPHQVLPEPRDPALIRVALYDGPGAGENSARHVEDDLPRSAGFLLRRIGATEIRSGSLAQFDLVVFPGGSGSAQARALTDSGRQRVRAFVRGGGGYVGICAGAYLAARNYPWSLKILDAKVIDRKHWRRGKALLKLELTPTGQTLLGAGSQLVKIRYANGPIYARAGDAAIPDFEILARYRDEVARNGARPGIMPGTPALVRGSFGQGRVFCASPHPESTMGLQRWVQRALHWTAGRR